MAIPITAHRILSVAIELEQTGKEFYDALASACERPELSQLARRLSQAEARHTATFTAMRSRLPSGGAPLPMTEEQAEYFHRLTREAILPQPAVVSSVALEGRLKDLVAMAIRMEKDSIEFYQHFVRGLQKTDELVIDHILQEERQHLVNLQMLYV